MSQKPSNVSSALLAARSRQICVPGAAAALLVLLVIAAACTPAASTNATPRPPRLSVTEDARTAPSGEQPPTPATPAPAFSPTPRLFPARVQCPDAPPTRLIRGSGGRVSQVDPRPLNVRAEPGLTGDIITRLEPDMAFTVLEGPVCADSYAWYRMRSGTLTGWIAEGDRSVYYVDPHPPE